MRQTGKTGEMGNFPHNKKILTVRLESSSGETRVTGLLDIKIKNNAKTIPFLSEINNF